MTRTVRAASVALTISALLLAGLAGCREAVAESGDSSCTTPMGWFLAGSAPAEYTACKVPGDGGKGSACRLSSSTASSAVFGTVMQSISAKDHLGKRVRLSASVRSEGVSAWSGVWLRIDRQGGAEGAFDNMQNRPIQGTTGWTRYDVVLDVAPDATALAFGLLQSGAGTTWIDDMKLEIVGLDVPTTDLMGGAASQPTKPVNLDFEK